MPSLTVDTLKQLKVNYRDYSSFVETGTFQGNTARNMADVFMEVNTIEIKPEFYIAAKEASKRYPNIKFHLGDSALVLKDVVSGLTDAAIFFLDGHYSSGNTGRGTKDCPLVEEFEIIKQYYQPKGIIIVDDYRLFGTKGNEDWSNITTETLLQVLGERVMTHYTLPSDIAAEDRLVIHISEHLHL